MEYLPLFFKLKSQPCLVVGGGDIALRKIQTLLKAGANVTIVALKVSPSLRSVIEEHQLQVSLKSFEPNDLVDKSLVIAATNDRKLNELVSVSAGKLRVLVNVVDNPHLSSVIFPSIIDRDPLIIAVSTAGNAPVLARLVRSKIEAMIPSRYGELAALVGRSREKVKHLIPDIAQRKAFWEKVLSGPVSEFLMLGKVEEAEQRLDLLMNDVESKGGERQIYDGEVYLVGAGPGDPDLLTFKALRLLQKADVILYDRLVAPEIVDLSRKDSEKIYVGKRMADHAVSQPDINEMLVKFAKAGKRVCRLKGGDPFIFGRGGEEIEKLVEHNISFQVVPGITAASGCASYAGIPLTHRDCAQSVQFVTGHQQENGVDLDWAGLASGQQTLVFYMGLSNLSQICDELINHGMDKNQPAALIQQGTTKNQKVIEGSIKSLPDLLSKEKVKAPTLIIIGQVVSLRRKLSWFN